MVISGQSSQTCAVKEHTGKVLTTGLITVMVRLILFLALFSVTNGLAETVRQAIKKNNNNYKDVLIIVPRNTKPYSYIVDSIRKEFATHSRAEQIGIVLTGSGQGASTPLFTPLFKQAKLIITLGAKATKYGLSENVQIPLLASFITESAFSGLSRNVHLKQALRKRFIGGISVEQPASRIMALATLIKPGVRSVGVVLGPNSVSKQAAFRQQADRLGWKLDVARINDKDNPVKKLQPVFQQNQLFIVVPDKARFNRGIARWVIALSYKHQVPVIAYSRKYADAGALVSLYSEPKQIGVQTAEMAIAFLDNPRKRYHRLFTPRYFNLKVNPAVNKALGLPMLQTGTLLKQLYRLAP